MNRYKLFAICFALASALFVTTVSPCRSQTRGSGPGQLGAATPPPTPKAPDLTPSGYLPTDPLYNDGEVKMGREAVDQINKDGTVKFCQDKAVVARVQAIGAKIAAIADVTQVPAGFGNDRVVPYHYTYHVIDSKEVNAFSLPGGFIYIYTGMLNLISSDEELAGVLGHETAHAAHHHVSTLQHEANKMSSAMVLGIVAALLGHVDPSTVLAGATVGDEAMQGYNNNVFSEHAEEDADHTGMIFMQKAGYNPVGMMTMLERLGQDEKKSPDVDLEFLQDHPLTPDRIASARAELASLGVTLDEESIREADNALPVLVSPVTDPPSQTVTIYVSNTPIVTLAEADRDNAVAAAKELDKLLDGNLAEYEIKAQGADLIAATHKLITITDADVKVQQAPTTPEALAEDARHKLAIVLWRETVLGVTN